MYIKVVEEFILWIVKMEILIIKMLEVKIFWNKNCFDLKISWNGDVIICNENLNKIVLWLESCKL